MHRSKRPPSSDHLVDFGEQRRRQREAEYLCGLQVDDPLECGRLLDAPSETSHPHSSAPIAQAMRGPFLRRGKLDNV
jgi:hypothetical protein